VTTLLDLPIRLKASDLLEAQRRRRKGRVPPRLAEAAESAVAMAGSLVAPAAVYREVPVQGLTDGQVILETDGRTGDPTVLTVGPKAHLLAPARRLLVAVYTIGPRLEEQVRELLASGEHLVGYLLDSAGVMALGQVGEALRSRAEARAEEAGWGTGPVLSPGSLVGWPVEGQRQLSALLPLESIGVELSDYCVLKPQKSASMVIGIGPGYTSVHAGSICRYCSLADRCWRRED